MVEAIIGNIYHLSKSESLHYSCVYDRKHLKLRTGDLNLKLTLGVLG